METKRYKPLIDKMFYIISIPTILLMATLTVICAIAHITLVSVIFVDILVVYLIVSPLFGYVELRENEVFVKFGLYNSRKIPYDTIRGVKKDRKFYSESMVSLKNAIEHVNIKYNSFDVTTVSVVDNDGFIEELKERCKRDLQ
jgi:hypothetical protein